MATIGAIRNRMEIGARNYDPNEWRSESVQRHALKAIRHIVTAMEIDAGDRPDDGEDHWEAGVCRVSMALAVRQQPKVVPAPARKKKNKKGEG